MVRLTEPRSARRYGPMRRQAMGAAPKVGTCQSQLPSISAAPTTCGDVRAPRAPTGRRARRAPARRRPGGAIPLTVVIVHTPAGRVGSGPTFLAGRPGATAYTD